MALAVALEYTPEQRKALVHEGKYLDAQEPATIKYMESLINGRTFRGEGIRQSDDVDKYEKVVIEDDGDEVAASGVSTPLSNLSGVSARHLHAIAGPEPRIRNGTAQAKTAPKKPSPLGTPMEVYFSKKSKLADLQIEEAEKDKKISDKARQVEKLRLDVMAAKLRKEAEELNVTCDHEDDESL